MAHCFVDYVTNLSGKRIKTHILNRDTGKKIKEVFWGDFIAIDNQDADWIYLTWGKSSENPVKAKIPLNHTTPTRPLEIIFLDVGQGDGAVLITPERGDGEAVIVIDAGEGDHMQRFLEGRFGKYRETRNFHAAVITHPDKDHYYGFAPVFADPDTGFDVIYQSGLVESHVGSSYARLGRVEDGKITDLALSTADIERIFGDVDPDTRKPFAETMALALANPRITAFSTLSTEHGIKEDGRVWMPGFAPSDDRGYAIEVLGPVMEQARDGAPALPKISGYGKTKNGHSVLLRLHFGDFKIFFGGDLNAPAERRLLQHYGGVSSWPDHGSTASQMMMSTARNWFKSDIMKVCHHGAADVTDEFISTVHPTAFVISSGDQEGHVHPRPDLLGRLGKLGHSAAPVILSTELQRSTREKADEDTVEALTKTIEGLTKAPTKRQREKMLEQVNELGRTNVQVHGAIYLKCDGSRMVTAFKKENNSATDRWFSFEYKMIGETLVAVS